MEGPSAPRRLLRRRPGRARSATWPRTAPAALWERVQDVQWRAELGERTDPGERLPCVRRLEEPVAACCVQSLGVGGVDEEARGRVHRVVAFQPRLTGVPADVDPAVVPVESPRRRRRDRQERRDVTLDRRRSEGRASVGAHDDLAKACEVERVRVGRVQVHVARALVDLPRRLRPGRGRVGASIERRPEIEVENRRVRGRDLEPRAELVARKTDAGARPRPAAVRALEDARVGGQRVGALRVSRVDRQVCDRSAERARVGPLTRRRSRRNRRNDARHRNPGTPHGLPPVIAEDA